MIEFFAFAVYPAYPAAYDHAYPVPVLSLMRMGYTTGYTSIHRIRVSVKSSHPSKERVTIAGCASGAQQKQSLWGLMD